MKQVFAELGGRPFTNDDLVTLQNELTDAMQAQFLGKGPFILSGCAVSGSGPAYNVAAGIVCLEGQLLRFAGAGGVTLPAQFQAGAVVLTDPRPYQTGGTKYCMREVLAVLVASDPTYSAGEFLPISADTVRRWFHVQQAQARRLGEVQYLANLTATDYDTTGLGKTGTENWGWALCNGNNGTADLRGQFVAGLDPARAAYDTVGKTGGEESHVLSIAEMPDHDHTASAPCNDTNNTGNGQAYQKVDAGQGTDRNRRTGHTGGGQAHNNLPPFYVLGVVQWVGY